jgi:ATP-dependent RNA helicase DDX46/PRP5
MMEEDYIPTEEEEEKQARPKKDPAEKSGSSILTSLGKKELKPVEHSKIKYSTFRKNIYVEARDITKMTEEDVKKFRKENSIRPRVSERKLHITT